MKTRRYETLILLHPDLSPEELEQIKQKITDIIESMSGKIIMIDDWGRRRLAYPVKKQMYGQYLLMELMGTPELLAELERNLGIDERVFKHLSLILDRNFTEEKYQQELDRIKDEKAKREAEKAQREAERAQREAAMQEQAEQEEAAAETKAAEPVEEQPEQPAEPAPATEETAAEPAPAAEEAAAEPAPAVEPEVAEEADARPQEN